MIFVLTSNVRNRLTNIKTYDNVFIKYKQILKLSIGSPFTSTVSRTKFGAREEK
jgi:hypothetical protein